MNNCEKFKIISGVQKLSSQNTNNTTSTADVEARLCLVNKRVTPVTNVDDTANVSRDTESDSEDEGEGDDKDNNIEDASQDIIFQVDSDIDIDLCALRDMISPNPIIIQPVS